MSTAADNKTREGSSPRSWEEWVSRLQAYVTWLNTQLKKHPNCRPVTDLRSDLQDGVVISQLVEVLSGERVANINSKPSTPSGRKENVEKLFQHLCAKKVPIFDATSKDVLEGDLKRIMRLIHAVASHYRPDSVLNPPSHKSGPPLRTEPNSKNMISTGKPPPSSLARQKQLTVSSSMPRKVAGGSSLPIRKQPLSSRECPKLRSTISSLSLDREKNNLRKSLNAFNGDVPEKGICDAENSRGNSNTVSRVMTPKVSCKVAPLQHSVSQIQDSKLTKKKLLVSRSEPSSLDIVDIKEQKQNNLAEQKKKIHCSCSGLNNDIIDQLLKDIREAKQQITLLQDLLLHGNTGKLIKSTERSAPYGSTDDLDGVPARSLSHDSDLPQASVSRRVKTGEPLSMICGERKDAEFEESTKLKSGCDPPSICKRNLKEENEHLRKAVNEKEQEIKRLKLALTSQVGSFDKKISKYPYSIPTRTQREELQVVHEALMSLRKCFPANDPYQHTLDTIEQSLSALLERVNSLEMATVPQASIPSARDIETLPGVVRRLSFESTNDSKHHSIPKISSFSMQRLEDNLTRSESFTKVVYYMDKSVTPFRCILHKRIGEATLRDFKLLFDRPGQYRYHFKTLDPEFGMVKEEVLHDEDILPGWDGKIIAWIEEDCS